MWRQEIDCSAGEERRVVLTASEARTLKDAQSKWASQEAERVVADELNQDDIKALQSGAADQETRDRLILRVLGGAN